MFWHYWQVYDVDLRRSGHAGAYQIENVNTFPGPKGWNAYRFWVLRRYLQQASREPRIKLHP